MNYCSLTPSHRYCRRNMHTLHILILSAPCAWFCPRNNPLHNILVMMDIVHMSLPCDWLILYCICLLNGFICERGTISVDVPYTLYSLILHMISMMTLKIACIECALVACFCLSRWYLVVLLGRVCWLWVNILSNNINKATFLLVFYLITTTCGFTLTQKYVFLWQSKHR